MEPDAWPAVEMFLRCQTQWRSGVAGLLGLDYVAVELLFRLYGAKEPDRLLEDMQVIEGEILTLIHDRKD